MQISGDSRYWNLHIESQLLSLNDVLVWGVQAWRARLFTAVYRLTLQRRTPSRACTWAPLGRTGQKCCTCSGPSPRCAFALHLASWRTSQDSFWCLCIDYGAAATSEKPAVHFNACDLHASLHILSNIGWRGVCAGSKADGGPECAGGARVLPRKNRAQAPPQRLRPHVPARAGHQRALCRRGPRCPQGIQGCPVSPSPSHYPMPFMVLQSLSPATLQFCLLFGHVSAIMKVAQHSLFSCVQRSLTSAVI